MKFFFQALLGIVSVGAIIMITIVYFFGDNKAAYIPGYAESQQVQQQAPQATVTTTTAIPTQTASMAPMSSQYQLSNITTDDSTQSVQPISSDEEKIIRESINAYPNDPLEAFRTYISELYVYATDGYANEFEDYAVINDGVDTVMLAFYVYITPNTFRETAHSSDKLIGWLERDAKFVKFSEKGQNVMINQFNIPYGHFDVVLYNTYDNSIAMYARDGSLLTDAITDYAY